MDNATSPPRAAWSIAEVCVRYSLAKSTVFDLLRTGKLQRVKVGRRTLIPAESIDAWWQSLPKAG